MTQSVKEQTRSACDKFLTSKVVLRSGDVNILVIFEGMPTFSAEKRPLGREIAAKSGLIFTALAAISIGIAALLYFNERRVQTVLLENSQRQQVDAAGEIIMAELKAVASDLMILAEGQTLAALLENDNTAARDNLAEEFRLVANQKQLYDQIRYLGEDGQEVVRINFTGGVAAVVPQSALQSKKDRYYFRQSLELGLGEIYVSPFDLNVENGEIEQPIKPTIRFGTPVFDAAGRRRGVVVVNYLGQRLLDKLDRAAGQPGHVMLLNADGHWLKGPDEIREWTFMYQDRSSRSFAAESPRVWMELQSQVDGQVHDSAGLFTFRAVHPAAQLHDSAPVADYAKDYRWLLVSHVPPDQLAAQSGRMLSGIVSLLGGVMVLLAVVSWLLGRSLVIQRETRRKLAGQERLAAIGAAMTALAHESRNALQRSQSGLELLARRLPQDQDARQLFDEVQEAQYHLRDMYEQARDWAAPLQLQPEAVDIGRLAETVWEQLAHERDGRQDSLEVEPADARLVCKADRRMIAQVLRNIFENSLAAANPMHIRVKCHAGETNDRMIRICVADDGPGLTDEQSRRLFEPFFTTRMRGTGLGMAISRRIIEAHGGTIAAHSPNGSHGARGTEIIIELPRETA